jgi:hypothetical protein
VAKNVVTPGGVICLLKVKRASNEVLFLSKSFLYLRFKDDQAVLSLSVILKSVLFYVHVSV